MRWTAYNAKTDTYQGELEDKTRYMKVFLNQRTRIPSYDYSRLEAVLETIILSATAMREIDVAKEWELANADGSSITS